MVRARLQDPQGVVRSAIRARCVEQDQGHSLGQGGFPGSTSAGGTILGREASSRVPQQLHEVPVLGSPWRRRLSAPMKHSRLFRGTSRAVAIPCGQLDAHDLKLVKRGSGVLRGRAVCLSNARVEELLVRLFTGGQGRARNGPRHARGCVPDAGAGKIRNIHCPALWLQHAVARRQIRITRRAGKDLPPDVGTKASPKTPCGDCWACLDWSRPKVG